MPEVILIGTGPAAISAAAAYRAAGGEGGLRIVGAEAEQPYARPPLSKDYLRGEIERHELELDLEHDAELLLGVPASVLERGHVRLADGRALECDACLLATGSRSMRIPVPGADDPEVLTLRSLVDAERIIERARGSVVVVGSGFIGCEIAASLTLRGAAVTLVTDEPTPQGRRLGDTAGARIGGWLEELGVRLVLGAKIAKIERAQRVVLDHGEALVGDVVLLATGSTPHGALAEAYGAPMHDGAVRVDAAMRADDFLLAAGDVAYARNAAAGRSLRVEHWGEAMRQGQVAGRTLAGVVDRWDAVPGFWTTIGERTLKYKAWGDGFAETEVVEYPGGGWTVFYRRDSGDLVGVLSYDRDEDYDRAGEVIVP
ncbi:MAG: NAD(P)/FAD-dependent oxidoreductase [Solirubrobacteraceae bacterium]